MLVRWLPAPHVQKLALVAVLTVTASHVVSADISLGPAVHGSTLGPRAPSFLPPGLSVVSSN